VNRDGRSARFCARLVIVALAGGILLELMHAIEGASPGFRPADWICGGAPAGAASAKVNKHTSSVSASDWLDRRILSLRQSIGELRARHR
jgi:hypothetical protein